MAAATTLVMAVTSLASGASTGGDVGATDAASRAEAAGSPSATKGPPQFSRAVAPSVDWGVCDEAHLGPVEDGYDCALYGVPLDYTDQSGPAIDVQLVRRPADAPATRLGTLFVEPGGPALSGFDLVATGTAAHVYEPEILERFDIVGFDPRGTGRSTGMECFTGVEVLSDYIQPFLWPETATTETQLAELYTTTGDLCEANAGPIIDHMSATNVAHDLNRLRRAVGDSELTYVGYSYGSYIGTVFANLYPHRVGALVLDGALDPVDWATGVNGSGTSVPLSARVGSDTGSHDTLRQFFRHCNHAGSACAISGHANRRFHDVVRGLDATPVTLGPGDVVDDQRFLGTVLGSLYDPSSWRAIAADTALLEALLFGENDDDPDERPSGLHQEAKPVPPSAAHQLYAVACSDSINPTSLTAWEDAAANSVGPFGELWTWRVGQCWSWPGNDVDRYLGPYDAQTANPVLIANPTHDPATEYAGAQSLHTMLPNSALLTVEGVGHTTARLSACADRVVADYLITRTVPAEQITCHADLRPFHTYSHGMAERAAARTAFMQQLGSPTVHEPFVDEDFDYEGGWDDD